jgi:hypothetical protein
MEVISLLVKAFDRGMSLKKREKPVLVFPKTEKVEKVDRRSYHEQPAIKVSRPKEPKSERRERYRYGDIDMVEISPERRHRKEKVYYTDARTERKERPKSTSYPDRRGSLYYLDEEEKRQRRRIDEEPIVIIAEPTRRYRR